ncbi:MAG: AbrB/MazE/SpoVT family DNA-binding domain-containing protein [Polaribacter sp.]
MEVDIIKVGNSKGIIIPSKFLKLIGLKNKVAIEVEDNKIVIEAVKEIARENWSDLFKANSKKDKVVLIPDVFQDENFEEWVW